MLRLSDSQRDLQARAADLAVRTIAPRAAQIDRDEAYPWDNVEALRDAGFLGMTIPEAYGGQGRSYLDAVLVIAELAKVCGVTARIAVETNMGASAPFWPTAARRRSGWRARSCCPATSRRSASPSPRRVPPPAR